MASVSAKRTARRLRTGPTFIQRSRSESSEQKAIWHNVTGAGPRGVIREFFGLDGDDKQTITETLERLLQGRIDQTSA